MIVGPTAEAKARSFRCRALQPQNFKTVPAPAGKHGRQSPGPPGRRATASVTEWPARTRTRRQDYICRPPTRPAISTVAAACKALSPGAGTLSAAGLPAGAPAPRAGACGRQAAALWQPPGRRLRSGAAPHFSSFLGSVQTYLSASPCCVKR